MNSDVRRERGPFPVSGYIGLILVVVCWILNWWLSGLRTHLLFFPLWLGYSLTVDGFVQYRKGSSRLTRNPVEFVLLFFLSAPVWWIFEALNRFTHNWTYLGREQFSDVSYFLFATLSFSTVIPAVFSTAELLGSIIRKDSLLLGFRFRIKHSGLWLLHITGWLMLILLMVYPRLFFPFMWLSLFFILDPLNALLGKRSLITDLGRGSVHLAYTYGMGALICGFFWELWNFYSFPKWQYSIPYLDQFHIFEMPLAGYGGYIPFGWELYALYIMIRTFRF